MYELDKGDKVDDENEEDKDDWEWCIKIWRKDGYLGIWFCKIKYDVEGVDRFVSWWLRKENCEVCGNKLICLLEFGCLEIDEWIR